MIVFFITCLAIRHLQKEEFPLHARLLLGPSEVWFNSFKITETLPFKTTKNAI